MDVAKGIRPLQPHLTYAVVFCLALGARGLYWVFSGTQVIGDARGVLSSCDTALSDPIAHFASPRLLYSGFEVPYCLFLQIPGTSVTHWVLVQVVLSTVGCVLLYDSSRRLVGEIAGWVAALGFISLWETFRWVVRPQSEALFTFVVILTLWQLTRHIDEPTKRSRLLLWAIFGWLALTRPFGVPLLAGYLFYDLLPDDSDLRFDLIPSRIVAIGTFIVAIAFGLVGLMLFSRSLVWSWSQGRIVTGGVATYSYTPRAADGFLSFVVFNVDHLLIMAIQRVLWVFAPVLPRWSIAHIVLNLVTLGPLLVGTVVATIQIYKRREIRFAQLWITPVIAILFVIAVTFLDGGFNYRAQLTPMFALLTGYAVGTNSRIERLATVYTRQTNFISR